MIVPTVRVMRPDGKGFHLVNATPELVGPATEETTPKAGKPRRKMKGE